MGLFRRLLGLPPNADLEGVYLREPEPWRVEGTKNVERFIRAVAGLLPNGSTIYFEDTAESHVARYLNTVSIESKVHVAAGTLWPKPDRYHVPLTAATMDSLLDFLEHNPAGFLCSHCHVYRNGVVLLQWHDAFTANPLYISRQTSEELVASFAAALGSPYDRGWF